MKLIVITTLTVAAHLAFVHSVSQYRQLDPLWFPSYQPYSAVSQCYKPNEEYNECGTSCPLTCENLHQRFNCNFRCNIGCFCKYGYVRNAQNECIDPRQCPWALNLGK